MRRLVAFSTGAELRYQAFDEKNRLRISDDFFDSAEESGYLIHDADAVGYYKIRYQEEVPVLAIVLEEEIPFLEACEQVALLSETCMRKYHPDRILFEKEPAYIHVMNACLYYDKGNYLQRKTEPWRKQLPDGVFDPSGFIIHQGAMSAIPFGWFNTMAKGCGWIAAYNLLKMCGMEQTMQTTAEELGRCVLLGGVAGQELYTMLLYLHRKGLNCKLSLSFDASAVSCMKKSRFGILLYSHKQGAHYTAYRNLGNGRFLFYNAVYGRVNHVEGIEEFLQAHELLPFSSVIYVL